MDDDPILRNYLIGIDRHPEMSDGEAARLAALVHDGEAAALQLRQQWPDGAEELGARIKAGRSARRALLDAHLRMVVPIATQLSVEASRPLFDLIVFGNQGLDNAIGKFDGRDSFSFREYAVWWIRQAILRELR